MISRRNFAEPVTLVRSPTLTNGMSSVSVNGSSPESCRTRRRSTGTRGVLPATASAIAVMWRRRRAAAAADDVDEPGVGELGQDRRGLVWRLVVATERVRQAGVRVRADQRVGHRRQLLDVRTHVGAAERAVEADRQRIGMSDRLPERRGGLARQRATGAIGDGAGDHQRRVDAGLGSVTTCGPDGCLGVERVEDRLDQQHVDATVDETGDLLAIRIGDVAERHRPVPGILDAWRHRQRHVGRPDRAGDPARTTVASMRIVGCAAGELRGGAVELTDQFRIVESVLALRDGGAGERVGGDDVGARQQVRQVQFDDRVGLGQHQQVVIPGERRRVVAEAAAAEIVFRGSQGLELGSAGAVEHQDALGCCRPQRIVRRSCRGRLRGGTELFAHRDREVGAVERVDVDLLDAVRGEFGDLLVGQFGGDLVRRLGVVVETGETLGDPRAGSTHRIDRRTWRPPGTSGWGRCRARSECGCRVTAHGRGTGGSARCRRTSG